MLFPTYGSKSHAVLNSANAMDENACKTKVAEDKYFECNIIKSVLTISSLFLPAFLLSFFLCLSCEVKQIAVHGE